MTTFDLHFIVIADIIPELSGQKPRISKACGVFGRQTSVFTPRHCTTNISSCSSHNLTKIKFETSPNQKRNYQQNILSILQ